LVSLRSLPSGGVFTPHAFGEQGHGQDLICRRHLPMVSRVASKARGGAGRIPQGQRVSGVVLADQTKSLDWRTRSVKVKGKAPEGMVEEVLGKLEAILFER
jgi:mRNA-degrading endonuclease toxin of MazEF toxin-antitoxin module